MTDTRHTIESVIIDDNEEQVRVYVSPEEVQVAHGNSSHLCLSSEDARTLAKTILRNLNTLEKLSEETN